VSEQFFQSVAFSLHNHLKEVFTVQSRKQLIISRGQNDSNFLICVRTKRVSSYSTCFWNCGWAIAWFYTPGCWPTRVITRNTNRVFLWVHHSDLIHPSGNIVWMDALWSAIFHNVQAFLM